MSAVYCQKCFKLRIDRTGACRKCGHWSPASRTYLTVGVLVVATIVGVCVTVLYAGLVSLAWEWWLRVFGGSLAQESEGEQKAVQAAILVGSAVFVVSTALAALIFEAGRRTPVVDSRSKPEPRPAPASSAPPSDETVYG